MLASIKKRLDAVRASAPNEASARTALPIVGLVVFALGLIVLLAIVLLRWAPAWLANTNGLEPKDAAAEVGRVRTALLAVIGGSIATAGVIYTARTYSLNREGQITDRFTRAIDQLGSESINVRLGAIFALERIARESTVDRDPIFDILVGFLREHSPEESDQGDRYTNVPPPTDFHSALKVIARRDAASEIDIDLSRVNLRGADFFEGRFDRAIFKEADLRSAKLTQTRLDAAWFDDTKLRWASFRKASLRKAMFFSANLSNAIFDGANLEGAWLGRSDLTKATFHKANLVGARLANAVIDDANFEGAVYNEATEWPDGFDPDGAGAVRV